jgi:hypothetical protein
MIRSDGKRLPTPEVLALLVGLVVCTLNGAARGDAGAAATVLVRSSPLVDAELVAAVRELLARRGAALQIGALGGTVEVAVVAEVILERRANAVLVSTRKPGGLAPSSEREVPLVGAPGLFRETLAHAIFGAVEPMLEPEPEPSSEAPSEQPPTSTPPPPATTQPATTTRPGQGSPRERRVAPPEVDEPKPADRPTLAGRDSWLHQPAQLQLGVRMGPRWFGGLPPTFALGGGVALAFGGSFRPALGVDVAYAWPRGLEAAGLEASVTLVPVRVRGRFEPTEWSWGRLELAGMFGLDVVSINPMAVTPTLLAEPASRKVQPILGATVGLRARVGPFDFFAAAGLDLDLAPRRWVVPSESAVETVLETGIVRPQVTVGFDLDATTFGPLRNPEVR